MRILWISNAPWSPSEYGPQTRLIVPRPPALGDESERTDSGSSLDGPPTRREIMRDSMDPERALEPERTRPADALDRSPPAGARAREQAND